MTEGDEIHSGGAYPFTERLSAAKACKCGGSELSVEDRGDSSLYGRAYRRIVCVCGRKGPWSTAPVQMWNSSF